jgi:hypothetical protein
MRQKDEKVQIQIVCINYKNQYWKKVGDNLPKRITKDEFWTLYDKSYTSSGQYIEFLPPITKEKQYG